MHILILGGSGRTGQLAIEAAFKHGHTVTALVRKASSLTGRSGLTIVEGTPMQEADIRKAFDGSPQPIEAVMVTLNAARESDSPFSKLLAPPFFIRDCVRNARAVMQQHGVNRIVIMSAFGIGSSYAQLPWLMKLVFKYTNMSFQMDDHHALDAEVRAANGLEWTLVRPAVLKEGEAAPIKDCGEFGKGAGLLSGVTRSSVADFMIEVAAKEEWQRKAVVITN